ncbi:hypothetical protein ACFQBS_27015 [Planomonospora parontospora]|uniref:hypothetical protein n=1 Tax=Planomonospora parontospora TaxID=58119 RepID=UPI00361624A0
MSVPVPPMKVIDRGLADFVPARKPSWPSPPSTVPLIGAPTLRLSFRSPIVAVNSVTAVPQATALGVS